jgi:hypothetical protein
LENNIVHSQSHENNRFSTTPYHVKNPLYIFSNKEMMKFNLLNTSKKLMKKAKREKATIFSSSQIIQHHVLTCQAPARQQSK